MVHTALRTIRLWRSLLCILFLLFFATRTEAGSLTLAWDPSPGSGVVGYIVAYGTQSRNYTTRLDVANATAYTIASIPNGVYYFAVQAYSIEGFTSGYSNEVIATVDGSGTTVIIPAGCTTPDPFATIGGGTCYNGGWLPPGMAVPGSTQPAPTPAPAPPPPSSGQGCQTADPFAGMGGGTCYNGGWLPPGMPVPGGASTPTPAAPKPTPPPVTQPPVSSPQGCTTADPFAALGGGTCFNGGWLPPGMPIPGSPSTPPPSTPPPSSPQGSQGCTTSDPFAGIGGGTCYNGGWLPPGMTPPSGGSTPSAPSFATPPAVDMNCETRDPFLSMGGGTCYKGGWVPAGWTINVTGTLHLISLDDAWFVQGDDGIVYTSPHHLSPEQHVEGATVTLRGSTLASLSGHDGVVMVGVFSLDVRQ